MRFMWALTAAAAIVLAACGPVAGPGGTNPPGPVRSATVDDLTAIEQPNTAGGSIVRFTVKLYSESAGNFTLHALGGYDYGEPLDTVCTRGTKLDARTCTWQMLGGELVGTFDVAILGDTTNDPSTLQFQFVLDTPSGPYPFVVNEPGVYSD